MKKFFVAILAILYLSSSTGATVYMHFCMGKFAGAGFGHHSSKTCSSCGMQQKENKANGCCKDKSSFFKSISDQETTAYVFQQTPPVDIALPVCFFEMPSPAMVIIKNEYLINHAPPLYGAVAVYIRNCVFLL